MVDVELSRAVAAAMRPRPRDKVCGLNAYRAMSCGLFQQPEMPLYVEGWVTGCFGPMWHAWLETPDGRLVEVTPTWLEQADESEYQPVNRYTIHDVLEHRQFPIGAGHGTPAG